mgnify:CR=1 FL=1
MLRDIPLPAVTGGLPLPPPHRKRMARPPCNPRRELVMSASHGDSIVIPYSMITSYDGYVKERGWERRYTRVGWMTMHPPTGTDDGRYLCCRYFL